MDILGRIIALLEHALAALLLGLSIFIPALAPRQTPNAPLPTQQVATTTGTFPVAPPTTVSEAKPAQKNGLVEAEPTRGPFSAPVSPTPAPIQTTPAPPAIPQEQINEETRAALVNILCTPQVGINGISGSGVVIDSRGVILTNAHIGQYFLLRDYITAGNITCTVRVGSPAAERYTATLLYMPPAWIAANAAQLKAAQATGTGEHDYAFLLITGRTDPLAALPPSFERVLMDRGYADIGDPMLLAAYPAGFLSSQIVQKSLYASSAIAHVTQLFSFGDSNKVDLFSVGGTVVSQGGSSGGAVMRLRDGKLAGIITTSTVAASTGERDLRAVSLAHIDDSLAASGKGGLIQLLTGDVSAKAADFNSKIAPALTAALEAALKGN